MQMIHEMYWSRISQMKISSVLLFIMLQKVHIPIRFYRILRTADGMSRGNGSGSGGNRSVTIEAPSDVTFTIDLTDTSAAKNVEVSQKKLKKLVVDNGNISKGKNKRIKNICKVL